MICRKLDQIVGRSLVNYLGRYIHTRLIISEWWEDSYIPPAVFQNSKLIPQELLSTTLTMKHSSPVLSMDARGERLDLGSPIGHVTSRQVEQPYCLT